MNDNHEGFFQFMNILGGISVVILIILKLIEESK